MLAGAAARSVEGHLRDAAHVDANRGQSAAGAYASAESLVERAALRDAARASQSVADFYRDFMAMLGAAGIQVKIWKMPVEIPNPIAFDQDTIHASYDPEYAGRFWRILTSADRVFKEFRSRFIGKCSPVHFFWGSFDLAVTRFSGRRAPERPGADRMTREAYSHEVSSVGFWPGGGDVREPMFYSYMAPQPARFSESPVRPSTAYYQKQLGEFLLRYEDVRKSASPSTTLLDFCQSTYEAGAELAGWDRAALEREAGFAHRAVQLENDG